MPLAVYNLDVRFATQGIIATRELEGVLLKGDDLISVTVDVENGNMGPGQWCQSINRVVLTKVLSQFRFTHPVGLLDSFASQVGPTLEVGNGIDSRDASNVMGVLHGPVVKHQTSAALGEQAGPRRQGEFFPRDLIKLSVRFPSLGIPI